MTQKTSKSAVHRAYWTEEGKTMSRDFGHGELDDCLKHTETLRKQRAAGANIQFITTSSENPDCTSLHGVAAPGVGYNWKKRRI